MDEQEKEFLMTINELRLQISLRNTEIVDLHRKNKILRDKLNRIREETNEPRTIQHTTYTPDYGGSNDQSND